MIIIRGTVPTARMFKREACPRCRAAGRDTRGDNLAVYADGHSYCFSCNFYKPAKPNFANLAAKVKVPDQPCIVKLPDDASNYIPQEPLQWLSNYKITTNEVKENKLMWSESRKLLIFPVYGADSNNLLLWQGRNFATKQEPIFGANMEAVAYKRVPDGPRYVTMGNVGDTIHIIDKAAGSSNAAIVLVEDMLSAIKVGRQYPCMPLFGSTITLRLIQRLKERFHGVMIWLDSDKLLYAVKAAVRASQLMPAFVISTSMDPKWFEDGGIQNSVVNAYKQSVTDTTTLKHGEML